jgi:endonuclease/exonuclease/phosphatase (EEP) superfamily protein YafD
MTALTKLMIISQALLASGCMMQTNMTPETTALANHTSVAAQGTTDCTATMAATHGNNTSTGLDPDNIGLFVWNIHKNKHPDALDDLAEMAGDMDLVLLQEARHAGSLHDRLQSAPYWSFAPGFSTNDALTGVMTLSSTQPLAHCFLQSREPWLGTPKAVGITEFALSDSDQTLAVVNIHGVNFTFGVKDYARQLESIRTVIENHDGPVIVAGDFNTWSDDRDAQVKQLAAELGMTELTFAVDHRVTPFAHTIDRVLVRGLRVRDATTDIVDSSDHNPLSVRLSL